MADQTVTGTADTRAAEGHGPKPQSPTDITKPSWKFVLRKTIREYIKDGCMDLAAGLTYRSVLAIFPALLATLSLLGIFGQGQKTVDTLMGILSDLGASGTADTIEPVLSSLVKGPGAGLALIIGLVVALWSASGYVAAFGRAMNTIYGIREGRPIWKLRPAMMVVTIFVVVLCAAVAIALIVSGPAARAIGNALGLGSTAVMVWNIAKWPVILLVVVLIVAILYYTTPNLKQPKFKWVSIGAFVAIIVWVLASAGFAFYVTNFGNYNKTYGSLGGVIVFLLWLWITNLVLLFGAELDAEIERGRELQAGLAAEKRLRLPLRDTRTIEKAEKQEAEDLARARALRGSAGETDEPH
ncbi:YihY/virulence factor BrkB family protein [Antricoccus suffuscus]|nr:YihY/virulence factor BrkB family protein [Antricoccus suffuscus]